MQGENPPFFVLSPGRSGSNSIADALDLAPGCVCTHEPEPALIEEATQWRTGEIGDDEVIELLTETRRWEPGATYGETNHKLAQIVPLLDRAFPGCRFVWLIRDGREFVQSYGRRNAHVPEERESPKVWKRWRPQGDLVGDVEPDRWNEMDPFERCCWHWSWVNRLIATDLAEIPAERRRRVRLEDLSRELEDVAAFVGLDGEGLALPRVNATQSAEGKRPKVPPWPGWDDARRRQFETWCGDLMDECYPDWRDEAGAWRPVPAATAA